jgi:peptidoglycan/LPS O-acetylase OafA/YrhL
MLAQRVPSAAARRASGSLPCAVIIAGRTIERPRNSLATAHVLERGGNCFGFIRLVLAALVILSHSWSIGGFGAEPLGTTNARTLGFVAVFGFFALSGALVARSAEGTGTSPFLWHRIRRIFPAYWACLLVTAVAIAPLIAALRGLPLGSVSHRGTLGPYTYFTGNFLLEIHQYAIGTVLHGLPYPDAINGSIWSLTYEFTCYLVVYVVVRCWIAAGRRNAVLLLALATSLVLTVFATRGQVAQPVVLPLLGTLDATLLYPLFATFFVSSVMALWRDWVPFNRPIVGVCIVACVLSVPLELFIPYGVLLLPYVVLGLGCYLPSFLRPVGSKNDLSYGLYLYGFPAGQILVSISLGFWGPISLAIASILLAAAFAAVSWFALERLFLHPGTKAALPDQASSR